jgi:hypothetical protein
MHSEIKSANNASAGACSDTSWHHPPPDNSNQPHGLFPQDGNCNSGLEDINLWNFGMPPLHTQHQTGNFLQTNEPPPAHGLPINNAINPSELNLDPSFRDHESTFRDYWSGQQNVQALPSDRGGHDHKTQGT